MIRNGNVRRPDGTSLIRFETNNQLHSLNQSSSYKTKFLTEFISDLDAMTRKIISLIPGD